VAGFCELVINLQVPRMLGVLGGAEYQKLFKEDSLSWR
jgi:hypothetical protein